MKVDIVATTGGDSLWSERGVQRTVKVVYIDVPYVNKERTFGELRAIFDKSTWDPAQHGLIYTDTKWLAAFRKQLVRIGFTEAAAEDVEYSEQGMQGANYVSMDVGKVFLDEAERWINLSTD